jgi:hypothetical protein
VWKRQASAFAFMITHGPSCFLPVVPMAQHLVQDVINYDYKPEITHTSQVSTFATAGLYLNLTIEGWPTLSQAFLLDAPYLQRNVQGRPACPLLSMVDPVSKEVLSQYPTHMLVLGDLSPPRLAQ